MPGLYSRLLNWNQDQKLTKVDLNAEFDNIISNSEAAKHMGASKDLATMQAVENPGGLGSEVYSTGVSTADEIERLRFTIQRILGGSKKWYEAPSSDISTISNFFASSNSAQNRIVTGLNSAYGQPIFVRPSASGRTAVVKGDTTNLSYSVAGQLYSLTTAVTSPVASVPVAAGNTATHGGTTFVLQTLTGVLGQDGNTVDMSAAGAGITAQIGKWIAFKINNEPMMGFVKNSTTITNCIRYGWLDSSGNPILRATHAGGETITLERLFFIFLTSTQTVEICETNPTASGTQPSSAAAGDMWFDLSAGIWKKYSGSVWAASNSLLVGFGIANATDCIAAKPLDYSNAYSSLCENDLEFVSSTLIATRQSSLNVNVYGTSISSQNTKAYWQTGVTVFEGGAIQNNTNYCLYLSQKGEPIISAYAPADRRDDLGGFYHIYAPFRALGTISTDGSGNFVNTASFHVGSFHRQRSTYSSGISQTMSFDNFAIAAINTASVGTNPTYGVLGTISLFKPNRKIVRLTVGLNPNGGSVPNILAAGSISSYRIRAAVISPSGASFTTLFTKAPANATVIETISTYYDASSLTEEDYVQFTYEAYGVAGGGDTGYVLMASTGDN